MNSNTLDKFNVFIQYIAPSKYGTEIYFRIIADKAPPEVLDNMLEYFNYKMGFAKAFVCLYSIGVVYLILGMIVITLKNRPLR